MLCYSDGMKELTQQEIADKLGVSQALVSRWLSGRHAPRKATVQQLAQVFDCDVIRMYEYLLDRRIAYIRKISE
jgi:transcriptional regulator with XRE-family HTH domain